MQPTDEREWCMQSKWIGGCDCAVAGGDSIESHWTLSNHCIRSNYIQLKCELLNSSHITN